ncbi:hypothetical protein PsYK624_018410 [Phanerochaete sordida]|uniref:Uncharacterized protein n=1 Tax=Phanerochaete sordida TaxID=48140 RepID=A0A9P3FYU8_9APHY|nr:hypothetical protein PsYK624_018410 [Phanerochaete sordida]
MTPVFPPPPPHSNLDQPVPCLVRPKIGSLQRSRFPPTYQFPGSHGFMAINSDGETAVADDRWLRPSATVSAHRSKRQRMLLC